ncbi:MAG: sulfatase, partial [Gammaproteobacteria bacterium]|nr:sulfatase [Gammaproteobacteria bacterium]
MKNIILLITDTFRFDNLFDYAKRPVNTPELDRFAEERASSLKNFYTGSFPTIPNRTDIATGKLGWPHYGWQPIDLSSRNHIGKTLRRQGYTTQLLCDCPHLFNSRFQFGFDAAYQHRGQEGDKHLLHSNNPIDNILPLEKTRQHPLWKGASLADAHRWINRYSILEDETFAAKTASTTVRWLEENHLADPFFIWVDFFDPHEPWDPPEYFVKKYDPDYSGTPMIHCNYGPATDYTEEELHNLWAHYAAESEVVDRHLGRVLQKIDDLNLWDNSIVVITSDHGTSVGEHNRTGKSNIANNDERYWPIYPEVGHVPFLIA